MPVNRCKVASVNLPVNRNCDVVAGSGRLFLRGGRLTSEIGGRWDSWEVGPNEHVGLKLRPPPHTV